MNKPVFILIHGFSSSNVWWKYKDVGTETLKKIDFLDNLKKLGDIYEHTLNFFNILYYYTVENVKEKERLRIIYKKYKPHTENLDFNIKDLYYKNICKNIHNNVIEKYGNNRKYVLVCHSYGCLIGMLYSKIYKKECLFNIFIDNPPYYLELFKEFLNSKETKKEKKNVEEYLNNNTKLQNMLNKIKNKKINENVNKEINIVFDLISYNDWSERIKNYDKILPIYTVFFRAFYPDTKSEWHKKWNLWSEKEQEILEKYNDKSKYEYIIMNNARHFIFHTQKESNKIINKIKELLQK